MFYVLLMANNLKMHTCVRRFIQSTSNRVHKSVSNVFLRHRLRAAPEYQTSFWGTLQGRKRTKEGKAATKNDGL